MTSLGTEYCSLCSPAGFERSPPPDPCQLHLEAVMAPTFPGASSSRRQQTKLLVFPDTCFFPGLLLPSGSYPSLQASSLAPCPRGGLALLPCSQGSLTAWLLSAGAWAVPRLTLFTVQLPSSSRNLSSNFRRLLIRQQGF